jgi:cyclopropane fatty-acyl-phospholipid synthase-like methyltransferase
MKQFSEACERNKQVILETIKPLLTDKKSVLEIGSGTGQHIVHFAQSLPHIQWQASDLMENHPSINAWIADSSASNILTPLELDTTSNDWPNTKFDAVYSANTAHIMPWNAVEAMFKGVATILSKQGLLVLYGPFNYNGEFTSESNRQFEVWLKQVNPCRGIRDFEAVNLLAEQNGLKLENDFEMPANNRLLVWRKYQQRLD